MDPSSGPVIVASGSAVDEATATLELRRRGFVVKHSIKRKNLYSYAMTLSRRLTAKLAAENKLPIQPIGSYSKFHQLTMANKATAIVLRTPSIGAQACWVAHDHQQLDVEETVARSSVSDPNKALVMIHDYYGSQIALYYGFIAFYTKNLRPPMLGGVFLFIHQAIYNQVDSTWLPIFCLGITVWSTFLLEKWKSYSAELAYAWGVYGWEDKELTAELAKGVSKEVGNVEVRRTLSALGMLTMIFVQVQLMLRFNHLQAHSAEYFGDHWYSWLLAPVLYFALCTLIGAIFDPISAKLNDFEMHPTKAQAEGSLVVKRFAFNFVNQFSALFYAAFWQRDLHRVRALSVLAFITHSATNQFLQVTIPRLKAIYKALTKKRTTGGSGSAALEDDELCRLNRDEFWEEFIRKEVKRPAMDLENDYLELALQFGHLSLFAVAFPLAPLLAYLSNLVEVKTDFQKLSQSRRPPAVVRSTIGAWQSCLEFISFASVFTNCFLLAMVSANIKTIIPSALHAHIDSDWGRLAAMMTVEHVLIALKIGIMLLVDDVPQWMKESLARDKMRAETERLNALVESAEHSEQSFGSPATSVFSSPSLKRLSSAPLSAGSLSQDSPFRPGSLVSDQVAAEDHLLGAAAAAASAASPAHRGGAYVSDGAAAKLVKECSSQFGFDPLNMSVLIAIPPLLEHVGVNPFLYVPLAVLYFSYLQASKDRADRKTAIGIVSDPTLVRLVVQEMPRWVSDSEHQRVEWFNSLLQKLWPQLSHALEPKLLENIQAVLDAQVVAVRLGLTMKRFSLGSISPKIVSIRLHETAESVVRLDVELRWAGDPVVTVTLGRCSYAPPVELTELRLSALVRIELLDLTTTLPCFKAVAVTFMQAPEVHFSLKVASLDFMNMGPADFNITALVRSVIDSVLQGLVVYPKKLLFPVMAEDKQNAAGDGEGVDVAEEAGASAAGVLYLTFVRGANLKRTSLFGCSPYITARTDRNQCFRSKAVHRSRNPEWHETFELLVFEPAKQSVDVEVLDADTTRSGVSLGHMTFSLANLKPSETVTATVTLVDVDTGTLEISYEYIPMQRSVVQADGSDAGDGNGDGSDDDDILYKLRKPDLESDVLCRTEGDMEPPREHRKARRRSTGLTVMEGRRPSTLTGGASPDGLRRRGSLPVEPGAASPAGSRNGGLANGRVVVSQRFAARYSVGILSVSLIHIRNPKSDTVFLSAPRLYVELTIADKCKQTKPQPGTAFPHFPERFSFIVKDLVEEDLRVEVKNRNKVSADKTLGSVVIPLSEVVVNDGVLEQEYMLRGAHAECFVGLRLEVTASS